MDSKVVGAKNNIKGSYSEDAYKVKEYIMDNVKSGIKSGIVTFSFNMIDIFAGVLKQTISGSINTNYISASTNTTNYDRYWKQNNKTNILQNSNQVPTINMFNRSVYDYETIEFDTQAMAEYCLHKLNSYISQNHYVTVGQYYQEARIPYSNVDMQWGWNKLGNCPIQRNIRGKWIIILPKAMEISSM